MPRLLSRRNVLQGLTAAGSVGIAGCLGGTEAFPSRSITIVVPQSAGGVMDLLAREAQPFLEDELGVGVNVENRAGAGGRRGVEYVNNQEGDGYTVLMASYLSTAIGSRVFDTDYSADDLSTIAPYVEATTLFVIPTDKWDSVDQFLEYSENNSVTYGYPSLGSALHLFMWFDDLGMDLNKPSGVPFSTPECVNALIRGQIDCANLPASPPVIGGANQGNIDILFGAIDLPPIELKYPTVDDLDYDVRMFTAPFGMLGPPGIPNDRLEVLNQASVNTINNEDFNNTFRKRGFLIPEDPSSETAKSVMDSITQEVETYQEYLEI